MIHILHTPLQAAQNWIGNTWQRFNDWRLGLWDVNAMPGNHMAAEAAIATILCRLGDTSDEIAENLFKMDCIGMCCIADKCPLSEYLLTLDGMLKVHVTNTHVSFISVATLPFGAYVPLPIATEEFVSKLDCGEYPFLTI